MAKSKSVKHPDLYTIFKPNHLILARKDELNITEIRVYNEVLNNNHKKYPEICSYKIPYENIIDQLKYIIECKQRLINELQDILASEMKTYIEEMLANKLSDEIKINIYKALSAAKLIDINETITLQIPANVLGSIAPNELEKLVCYDCPLFSNREASLPLIDELEILKCYKYPIKNFINKWIKNILYCKLKLVDK